MNSLVNILVCIIAVLHLYFLYLEMFAWTTPIGLKIFRNDAEFAKKSAVLAANQGLYNGFLAAGLIWSLLAGVNESLHLKIFFLSCIVIAGIYGGCTANKRIFIIQGLPALITLAMAVNFYY
jgi:putative membrane protein